MAQKKNPRTKSGYNGSFLLTLALLAFAGYFVITVVSLQFQISDKQQELETAKQTLSSVQAENESLKELEEEEDEATYMERIARDVLGYVVPGESVYYDVSTGN